MQDSRARLAGWVDLVHLVCFVHLVSLVQPNKPNRPNKQEKPAGSRTSRATASGGLFQHPSRVGHHETYSIRGNTCT